MTISMDWAETRPMVKTHRPIAPLDEVTRRRGAALLLDVLRSEGVRYIFGNPGTTELPLIDALIDAPDISYIWGLQEASVVAMADGYAQAACRRPDFSYRVGFRGRVTRSAAEPRQSVVVVG
jgi:Thiamine pyrophosphate enzyme, N-terminal TPP binding domain